MKEIREIGLEKEMFLIKDDNPNPMEPSLYGFPYDEMGFLVELRSLPSDRAYPIITTLFNEELQYKLRADKFGMKLIDSPNKYVSKEFVRHIEDFYNILNFPDNTKNIYNERKTHHLGVFPDGLGYNLTAGIHVHFSSRDSDTGKIIDLPIEKIVKLMDKEFEDIIQDTGRIRGEYELKKHGFEYRSLPCSLDITNVVKESFRILRGV